MNKDVRDKYLKFIRNRYSNKPADYDFKTAVSDADVELSNRVFLLTCDENGDPLTDKRKAEETYIKEYPSLYAETLNDIYETIGKKEIDDYTIDDLFRFLLKRYSPKILTYKDFFVKTDTLDCFLMANYYAPSFDGNEKVYPVTGNQIGAATGDLITLPDFVFLFELPSLKNNTAPCLPSALNAKKLLVGGSVTTFRVIKNYVTRSTFFKAIRAIGF